MNTIIVINQETGFANRFFNVPELTDEIQKITSKAFHVIGYPEPQGKYEENIIAMEKEMSRLIGDLVICLTVRVCSRSGLLIESLKLEHNKNAESFVEVQLKSLNIKSDE